MAHRGVDPDLSARRLLMSALLYYQFDSPVWEDWRYDQASKEVAAGWKLLSPYRQWCLGGSLKAMLATGYHYRITEACAAGAASWHLTETGLSPPHRPLPRPKHNKKWGVWWIAAGG